MRAMIFAALALSLASPAFATDWYHMSTGAKIAAMRTYVVKNYPGCRFSDGDRGRKDDINKAIFEWMATVYIDGKCAAFARKTANRD